MTVAIKIIKRLDAAVGKAIRRPVLATSVAILLWGLNAINIQPLYYELATNVAVSEQRVSRLMTRCDSKSSRFRVIDVKMGASSGIFANSELRTARIRVRVSKYSEISSLEAQLEAMTRPENEPIECKQREAAIRQTSWELETIKHNQKLVAEEVQRNNQLREAISQSKTIETETILENSSSKSPIQLAGHKTQLISAPVETDPSVQNVLFALEEEKRAYEKKIETQSNELETLRTKSKGFFSFSGAQRVYPVVPCVSKFHATVLLMMTLAVWGLATTVMSIKHRNLWHSFRVHSANRRASKVCTPFEARRRASSDDFSSLCKLGIPHLGSFDVPAVAEPCEHRGPTVDECLAPSDVVRPHDGLSFLSQLRIAERGIALWFVVLLLRLLFDGIWRELFLAAPFAALSHLILGVP